MIIKTIIFKRGQYTGVEAGIEIEGSVIIDVHGKVVPAPIYKATDVVGISLDLEPVLTSIYNSNIKL